MKKALLSWSGGKDCALALARVREQQEYDVIGLLTTVTEDVDRISMHGVRRELLEVQAEALQLPLDIVYIPPSVTNKVYEQRMAAALKHHRDDGVETVIFGDMLLTDIRSYREEQLARFGIEAHFPLWGEATDRLVERFVEEGYKAITVCVDREQLSRQFIGRKLDKDFLDELPDTADPCGENGEYHTFVYGGPVFSSSIPVQKGDIVLRDGRFYYCDLWLDL